MNNFIIDQCVVLVGLFSSLYPIRQSRVQEDDLSSLKSYKVSVCVYLMGYKWPTSHNMFKHSKSLAHCSSQANLRRQPTKRESKIKKDSEHPGNTLECLTGFSAAAEALNAAKANVNSCTVRKKKKNMEKRSISLAIWIILLIISSI